MLKSELGVDQFVLCPHPYPASSLAVSHDLVQSSPLLRVTVVLLLFAAKGRNVCMTNVRSSTGPKDCNIGRIATPLPKHGITSSRMNAHTRHSQLVPRVAVKSCHNVFRPCPSLCTRPCHCHSVSAWLKQVCMHRAMPQLSETEMGFDFRNPVASVRPGPLTHTCWQSRSAVSKQTVLLCAAVLTSTKNFIKLCIFTHIVVLLLLFEKSFTERR